MVVVGRTGVPLVSVREGGDEAVLLAAASPARWWSARIRWRPLAPPSRNAAPSWWCWTTAFSTPPGADLDVVIVSGDPRHERLLPRDRYGKARRRWARPGSW